MTDGVRRRWLFGDQLGPAFLDAPDQPVLLTFLAVAVLSSVVPYAFELEALRRMPTRIFGVLSSLGPAAAAIAGLLVLGQALGWRELVALLLVTVASVGVTVARGRREAGRVRQRNVPYWTSSESSTKPSDR